MATKAVTLGQKNGNAVDVALPRTSADLVGYENAEAGGVTDVAAALDTLFEGAADVIVAPGGPDNYLEKTPEGLVVRGVQTSTNQIMMGSTTTVIRSSVIPVSTVALVRLDNLIVPPEAFPENDADIADVVVEGEGNAAYTTFVLQPGTYHFGVASTNAQANGSIGRLFKKAKDGWVVAVTGTYVSTGDQQISILIDCHFTIAEETVFAIGLGVGNWNSFEVTIQKFADASLLAPALIQSKGGLFTGVLSDAGPGFFTSEDNFWKSIGFSGVQYSDLVDSQDDIVAPARTSGSLSGFDAFEVKASGLAGSFDSS